VADIRGLYQYLDVARKRRGRGDFGRWL